MVKTRAHNKSVAASYRRHRKSSACRGKGPAACRGTPGCKHAVGKKRSFCRKTKNTHTRRNKKQSGGVMAGAMAAVRQALLPATMYVAQKSLQRKGTRSRRTRRRRR